MMTPSRLERGSTANPIANFRRRRRQYGEPQTALVVERMERLWKNEGATERKQFERFKPRNRPQQAKSLCHLLPRIAPKVAW